MNQTKNIVINFESVEKNLIFYTKFLISKQKSHSSIHKAAINKAMELVEMLDRLLKEEQFTKALEVAFILVEHWETRTLQHSELEEEGLYRDLVKESPELKETIIALTRDHQLLRLLVMEINGILMNAVVNNEVLQRFQALILVDLLHNQDEMKLLPKH
jgi:hypothetical protein